MSNAELELTYTALAECIARVGEARAREPHHGDTLVAEAGDLDHSRCYLSFKVERPAIARIEAMIQKRMTMVGSCQPFFSKW